MTRTKTMQDFVHWAVMPSRILGNPSMFRASNPDIKTSCSGSQALSNVWFGCSVLDFILQLISPDVQILAEVRLQGLRCFPSRRSWSGVLSTLSPSPCFALEIALLDPDASGWCGSVGGMRSCCRVFLEMWLVSVCDPKEAYSTC